MKTITLREHKDVHDKDTNISLWISRISNVRYAIHLFPLRYDIFKSLLAFQEGSREVQDIHQEMLSN